MRNLEHIRQERRLGWYVDTVAPQHQAVHHAPWVTAVLHHAIPERAQGRVLIELAAQVIVELE
jgi:hypothetical protein